MDLSDFSVLLRELKRRHVFKVGMTYGVVAWLVAQVAALFFPHLGLPPWTVTLVVVLAVIGFPIALVLAWALELTPEGVQRTRPETAEGSPRVEPSSARPRERRTGYAPPPPLPDGARAIAVLPFANLSPAADAEYFSDGMTEELIDALSRVDGLRVVSRTSSFALKGKLEDVRRMGRLLRAHSVLEGSVRRTGNHLRVTTKLIEVETGYHLWSRRFDREVDDLFAIQEEIAQEVARSLRVELGAGESAPLVRSPTDNLEAHDLFLRGRFHWQRRTQEGLHRAIGCFERAIELDPGFALAHTGLADAYAILWDYGFLPPEEAYEKALAAARTALRLDPARVEALTSLAMVHQLRWEFAAAEAELRRALSLDPRYPTAHHRYALQLTWLGRTAEAREQIRQAHQLDPLALSIHATVGWVEYFARSYDAAVEAFRATLELDPGYALAHLLLGRARVAQGRLPDGIEACRSALRLAPGNPAGLGLLAHALALSGQRAEALDLLRELTAHATSGGVHAYHVAVARLGLQEPERALEWLQRAFEQRDASLVLLAVDPLLDPVRDTPQVRELTRRIGLAG